MDINFQPESLPSLIGSLPMDNHDKATELVFKHTPEIPLWVQLPVYKEEGMINQFLPGIPGITKTADHTYIDTKKSTFDQEVVSFYEEYLAISEMGEDIENSRFALTKETAKGFFSFLSHLKSLKKQPVALKGQVTGPFTLATSLVDENKKAVFYDDQLRDIVIKQVAFKAKWQANQLKKFKIPVIIFFDEPALTGFGSSAFISITKEDVSACFCEVIAAVHSQKALTGIHVCANAEWPVILDSPVDIVSFDAYSFFDRFILYPDEIKKFLEAGKILAWGIVPTLSVDDLRKETAESIYEKWKEKAQMIEKLGISLTTIKKQSLITPSCGTGSLKFADAVRVLELTSRVSEMIRKVL